MPDGGDLTIETANAEPSALQLASEPGSVSGAYVRLRVSDTGTGMDAGTRSHLFEPFFTTKALGKGTGMGLSMVHGIIKQNGGLITVTSPPQGGSMFEVFLPRVDGPPSAARPASDLDIRAHGETVLVVEDDPSVRAVAVQVLERLGYRVESAGSAEEALERVVAGGEMPVDLLLTDVILPSASGRQVSEALQLRRPGIRTLYMSGYTSDVLSPHGVLDQDVQFIEKPFTPESLGRAVHLALTGEAGATRGLDSVGLLP
jgi:two-component system cell cycle sensor histidine kinase/response regulator CckA